MGGLLVAESLGRQKPWGSLIISMQCIIRAPYARPAALIFVKIA